MIHQDSDSADEHRPYRVSVCVLGGCIDPERLGHADQCPLSAEWIVTGEFDGDTYMKLNARVIGMEMALTNRGYEPGMN